MLINSFDAGKIKKIIEDTFTYTKENGRNKGVIVNLDEKAHVTHKNKLVIFNSFRKAVTDKMVTIKIVE